MTTLPLTTALARLRAHGIPACRTDTRTLARQGRLPVPVRKAGWRWHIREQDLPDLAAFLASRPLTQETTAWLEANNRYRKMEAVT